MSDEEVKRLLSEPIEVRNINAYRDAYRRTGDIRAVRAMIECCYIVRSRVEGNNWISIGANLNDGYCTYRLAELQSPIGITEQSLATYIKAGELGYVEAFACSNHPIASDGNLKFPERKFEVMRKWIEALERGSELGNYSCCMRLFQILFHGLYSIPIDRPRAIHHLYNCKDAECQLDVTHEVDNAIRGIYQHRKQLDLMCQTSGKIKCDLLTELKIELLVIRSSRTCPLPKDLFNMVTSYLPWFDNYKLTPLELKWVQVRKDADERIRSLTLENAELKRKLNTT